MKKLVLILAFCAGPLWAQQDPASVLQAASREIIVASAAMEAAAEAEGSVQALSAAIRGLESGLASLRVALQASKAEEVARRAEMAQMRGQLGQLLATLSSLQSTPAELSVIHPNGVIASARAGTILSSLTPALRAEVAGLRTALDELAALTALHDTALQNLQTALGTLQSARNALAVAIREERPDAGVEPPRAGLSQMVRASQDLNTLAAALRAGLPMAGRVARVPTLREKLPLPLVGTLTRRFNAPNGVGVRQPGIVMTAPALSLVLAPQAGVVRFAGDFMEYGQVVIVEPSPSQLQIYAGFGQVYVKTGEVLESGAAMGLLGGEVPDSAEFLAENSGENDNSTESLYIEIRENGIPVDPENWFTIN